MQDDRYWVHLLDVPVARYWGAEGDDGGEGSDDGDDGQEDDPAKSQEDKSEKKEETTYSQDYVDKLRSENAKRRVSKNETDEKLAKVEAELAKIREAEMGDLDKAKAELDRTSEAGTEAEKRAIVAEAKVKALEVEAAVTSVALELKFNDPTDALAMIPQDDLFTDDGDIDPTAIKKALKKLAEKKTYLIGKPTSGSGDGAGDGKPEVDPKTHAGLVAKYTKQFKDQGRVTVEQ